LAIIPSAVVDRTDRDVNYVVVGVLFNLGTARVDGAKFRSIDRNMTIVKLQKLSEIA
jgi:hypothetical protein